MRQEQINTSGKKSEEPCLTPTRSKEISVKTKISQMKHPSGDEDEEYSSLISTLKDLKKDKNKVDVLIKKEVVQHPNDFEEEDNHRV